MTKLFGPPRPIQVVLLGARPACMRRPYYRPYSVTRITNEWMTPAPWWDELGGGPARQERHYYRVVLDHVVVWEIYREGGAWFLSRI